MTDDAEALTPERFDVDGVITDEGISLIGLATRVDGNLYRCLANVHGALCTVEVKLTILPKGSP